MTISKTYAMKDVMAFHVLVLSVGTFGFFDRFTGRSCDHLQIHRFLMSIVLCLG